MKKLLTITAIILSGVSALAQTRNVVVGTNDVIVSPTNFWNANASNAISGIGLGTAATNSASAFQPASSVLTNLANNNGTSLTNISINNVVNLQSSLNTKLETNGNAVQLTNFPTSLLRTNGNAEGLTNITAANIIGTVALASNVSGTVALASNVSGIIAITNGGSGATTSGGARTNLGLTWTGLTNTNSTTFQSALFGSGTNPVLVDTGGSVVSPTNFWQVAPILTIVDNFTPIANATNTASSARNLFVYSLAPSTTGVTNTILLRTNGTSYAGDVAVVIHEGGAGSVTQIRQTNAVTNIVTLDEFGEAVRLVFKGGSWIFFHNISFSDPIKYIGTNEALLAAQSRTNLGIPLLALTNTNVTNFRTAIELGTTNNVQFSNIVSSGTLTATGTVTVVTNLNVGGAIAVTNAAVTRTNFGLGATWLTNTNVTNFRTEIELGSTNNVIFSNVTSSGTLTSTGVVTTITNLNVGGTIAVTNAAATRTNLGLGGGITTNLVLKNSANNDTYMNFSNGILIYGSTTPP